MNGPDYKDLIDADVWAYISKLNSYYPADISGQSIADKRADYDRMAAGFHLGRPAQVTVTDEALGGVPCRRYEVASSDVTVVYYHGGGFVVGGLDSHDDVCAEICARTGFRVISVDYGLAPEVIFPECFNDAWAAFAAIAQRWPEGLVLSGDSAGGNLAAAVTHQARHLAPGRVVGQVLIYPGLGGDPTKGSYVTHANAPHLTTADMAFYNEMRRGGAAAPTHDPRYAPLQDADFTGLPPVVVVTAECDPLASDGESYRDAVRAAGGRAVWFNEPGLVHGCMRARAMSARAAGFFDRVVAGIDALGNGVWPYEE